jgi:predicted nuclease with TOPRIM domain
MAIPPSDKKTLAIVVLAGLLFFAGTIIYRTNKDNAPIRKENKELKEFVKEQKQDLDSISFIQAKLEADLRRLSKQKQDVKQWKKDMLSRPPILDNDTLRDEILRTVRLNPDGVVYEPAGQRDTGYLVFPERRFAIVKPDRDREQKILQSISGRTGKK